MNKVDRLNKKRDRLWNDIRAKVNLDGSKPKGMHWKTYYDISNKYHVAEYEALIA
jgi:hypothetical protein